jgi:hypothetical protein
MTFIEGEITIARPAETVFDFAADQRNEPRYNPRMVRAEKVTGGPVGQGTVFRSAVRAMGQPTEMRCEVTGYRRPAWLASRSLALIAGGGTLAWADQEQLRSGHWGSPRPRPPRCCWLARTGRWTGTSRRPARSRPR